MTIPTTLLAPVTGAAQSASIHITGPHQEATVVLCHADGSVVGGAETAAVEIAIGDGTVWHPMYVDGSQVLLSSTNSTVKLDTPGRYRVNKGVTAIAAGVYSYGG